MQLSLAKLARQPAARFARSQVHHLRLALARLPTGRLESSRARPNLPRYLAGSIKGKQIGSARFEPEMGRSVVKGKANTTRSLSAKIAL